MTNNRIASEQGGTRWAGGAPNRAPVDDADARMEMSSVADDDVSEIDMGPPQGGPGQEAQIPGHIPGQVSAPRGLEPLQKPKPLARDFDAEAKNVLFFLNHTRSRFNKQQSPAGPQSSAPQAVLPQSTTSQQPRQIFG